MQCSVTFPRRSVHRSIESDHSIGALPWTAPKCFCNNSCNSWSSSWFASVCYKANILLVNHEMFLNEKILAASGYDSDNLKSDPVLGFYDIIFLLFFCKFLTPIKINEISIFFTIFIFLHNTSCEKQYQKNFILLILWTDANNGESFYL